MKRLIFICAAVFGILCSVSAQSTNVQPKIMVIPKTFAGEDIRTVIEQDADKRAVLVKIKEAFDNRGFTTVDFMAKLKAISQQNAFNEGNQADIKSQLIEMSGADIYVEAEINCIKSAAGNGVRLTIEANEVSTGSSLANTVAESGKFYTEDWGKLATVAIDGKADAFLNTLQAKFNDIIANGQAVTVNFSFDSESPYDMDYLVGADELPLSDALTLWMDEHAYNGNYHIQGTTSKQMMFDDVKIPLKDPKNGSNYSANKFALEILKLFRSYGLNIGRDVKGSAIFITIK